MNKSQSGFLIIALTTLVFAGCTGPAVDVTKEADAVSARSKACATAEAAKDIEGAIAFWAEDAIVQAPGSPQIQGRQAIADMYRNFFKALKEFSGTTSQVTVSRSGDLAFEYGVNRMVYPSPKSDLLDMGKYLVVWKKVKDDWYIVALAVTSDAPTPVPLNPSK